MKLKPIMTSAFMYAYRQRARTSSDQTMKRAVHLHGRTSTSETRPPDPSSLLVGNHLEQSVSKLYDWIHPKANVLCLTGAGISTASGIPDYRGHDGSYAKGHKPMIHDQFMNSAAMRQRYWGRAMMGWRDFAKAAPNEGHVALAQLESQGCIGVTFEDSEEYYEQGIEEEELGWAFTTGSQSLSVLTQNVDGLHRKAGSTYLSELHGRNDVLKCMNCGSLHCRHEFHDLLEDLNNDWVQEINLETGENSQQNESALDRLRPDGDAHVKREVYDNVLVPPCPKCGVGFLKPDVVFFGDSVPRSRVNKCHAAVAASDGLLCIGSSLAVYSAFRFVQSAAKQNIPIAILNVGETRAEKSGLDVLKIESPIGPTLVAITDRIS